MTVFCSTCGKVYSTNSNFNRHVREVHPDGSEQYFIDNYPFEKKLYKCLEKCDLSFKHNNHLREHLKVEHNFKVSMENLTFKSQEDFEEWLTNIEITNNSKYSKPRGVKRSVDGRELSYFNCSRSGVQKTLNEEHRKRNGKLQGSPKLNLGCTSQIILEKCSSNEYVVKYFKEHYGHDCDLKHLVLSENCRKDVALKLMMGVTPEYILRSVSEQIEDDDSLRRDDLLTMKDIHNIKASFKIYKKQVDDNENSLVDVEPNEDAAQ